MNSIENDARRIAELGGPAAVAKRISEESGCPVSVQRVHNWQSRGVPPAVKLRHPQLFLPGMVAADVSQVSS